MAGMIHALVLVAGALGWIAAEAVMVMGGAITVEAGTLVTVALFLVAAGVWALREDAQMGRPGRVGIVLVSFGTLSLGVVTIIMLTSGALGALARGEIGYGDMVWTPFFALALVFMVAGLTGFGFHYRQSGYPGWVAPAFFGLAGLTVLRFVLPDLAIVHAGANMGVAGVLAILGAAATASAAQARK